MSVWKTFECPRCHEPFPYEPSPKTEKNIEEMELKAGRTCLIMANCPHCVATITLDRDSGRTSRFDEKSFQFGEMGAVVYDMVLKENTWDLAEKLVKEGHEQMPTNPARAEECFRKALTISKHHPQAWYNLGVCRQRVNDFANAVVCFEHALQYDPQLIQGWNNLGSTYALLGKFDDATRCFDQGIAVDPNYPKFYLGKANVAAMQNDFTTAKRLLHQALEKDPTYEMARVGLRRIEQLEQAG